MQTWTVVNGSPITGNCVTIRHAEGEYSSLVHLIPGTIAVEPGDFVERGEQVGRCGHSGNSSEPHLHFQLQDHPPFEIAAGVPVRFDAVAVDTPGVDVVEATDWDEPENETGHYIHVGQRVTHAPDTASRRSDTADAPETTAATDLGGVPTLGRVAEGLAVSGAVTVLAGVVGASVLTIALGLAGLADLALAYQGGRDLLGGDRVRLGSVAMVGAVAASNLIPALGPSTVGAGVFMSGFLVYLAV